MPTYAKPKEKVFEAFSPFAVIQNKKIISPTLANIALFGTTKVVEKAVRIFQEQVGANPEASTWSDGNASETSDNQLTLTEERDFGSPVGASAVDFSKAV